MLVFKKLNPEFPAGWLQQTIFRAKIPGGWLVFVWMESSTICFVPDPKHEWDGASLPNPGEALNKHKKSESMFSERLKIVKRASSEKVQIAMAIGEKDAEKAFPAIIDAIEGSAEE